MVAYAVRITKENLQAIASEHPRFSTEEIENWIEEHTSGYFLRDPQSSFDCQYFEESIFSEFYEFVSPGSGELFERVTPVL